MVRDGSDFIHSITWCYTLLSAVSISHPLPLFTARWPCSLLLFKLLFSRLIVPPTQRLSIEPRSRFDVCTWKSSTRCFDGGSLSTAESRMKRSFCRRREEGGWERKKLHSFRNDRLRVAPDVSRSKKMLDKHRSKRRRIFYPHDIAAGSLICSLVAFQSKFSLSLTHYMVNSDCAMVNSGCRSWTFHFSRAL